MRRIHSDGSFLLPVTKEEIQLYTREASEMREPNDDIRKCIEGVAKLIEESLPIVYYATHESIEDDHVYSFENPKWYLMSPGDFERLKGMSGGLVVLKHVREMPVEAWPPPAFMNEQLLDDPSFRLGRAWGLKV